MKKNPQVRLLYFGQYRTNLKNVPKLAQLQHWE
jgi:hypothetical protein